MINLSLNELELIAQIKNISHYEDKSTEDLIKTLSEPKPKTTPKQTLKREKPKTRPKTKPEQTLKPETPKQTLKPKTPKQTLKPETPKTTLETRRKTTPKQTLKPETKLEVKFNRKKLENLRKDFDKLRHKFSNKDEISEYRKAFYNAKKRKLFESEIENTNKNLNKLKNSLTSKKFQRNIDSVDYEDLDSYNSNYDFADAGKYRKL